MRSMRSINQMWSQACDMVERADRLQRQFFRLGLVEHVATWEPPIDIFESNSELLIRVAVPDVNSEDFEIIVVGATLYLSGQRCLPTEAMRGVIRQLETPYGQIQRRVNLPAGGFQIVAYTYNNGCFDIRLQRVRRYE